MCAPAVSERCVVPKASALGSTDHVARVNADVRICECCGRAEKNKKPDKSARLHANVVDARTHLIQTVVVVVVVSTQNKPADRRPCSGVCRSGNAVSVLRCVHNRRASPRDVHETRRVWLFTFGVDARGDDGGGGGGKCDNTAHVQPRLVSS